MVQIRRKVIRGGQQNSRRTTVSARSVPVPATTTSRPAVQPKISTPQDPRPQLAAKAATVQLRPYSYRHGFMISACGCLGVVIYAGIVLFKPPVMEEEYASEDLVREFIKDTDGAYQADDSGAQLFSYSGNSDERKASHLTLFPEEDLQQKVMSMERTVARLQAQKSKRQEQVVSAQRSVRAVKDDPSTSPVWTHKITFIAGLIAVHRPNLPRSGELSKDIVELSLRAGVDPFFTAAIISVESGFQPFARSNKGATGLMQLMPATARDVFSAKTGRDIDPSLTDPRTNMSLGITYIKQLDQQFKGNKKLALAAYNWGPGNVSDAVRGQKRIPKSVIDYAKMVLDRAIRWRKQFDDATQSASSLVKDFQ